MDILVDSQWLAACLGNPGLVVLDASAHLPAAGRDAPTEFENQHVAGARFLGLGSLRDETSPVPAALPRVDQFEKRLRALGISNDDRIVLYDDSMLRSSTRAFFMFRMFGIENVAILDGGLGLWKAGGHPVESGMPVTSAGNFTVTNEDRSRVRSKADMLANCNHAGEQIVDARDARRFTGEVADTVHGLEGGHIPGARNLFFRSLLKQDGSFKSADDLHTIFDSAGIDLARPVVTSCGSGMTASVLLFAMELLGKSDGALYDGSWSEWGAAPETPKEMGVAR